MDIAHTVFPLFDGISYLGIFLLIIFSGYILPVPEELFLIIIGYLVYAGVFPLVPVLLVAILATFAHDQILFYLGKSEHQRAKWFLEKFSQVTFLSHDELVKHHTYRVIFYSRFIPYVRLVGPLLAGSEKVPWRKFALVDGAALLLYVPLSIAIGYYFHGTMELIISKLTLFHHFLTLIIIVSVGLSIGWYIGTKLELEKKIISVLPISPKFLFPILFLALVYGGYVGWIHEPEVQVASVGHSELFIEKDGLFTFRIPAGFHLTPAKAEESLRTIAVVRSGEHPTLEIVIQAVPSVALDLTGLGTVQFGSTVYYEKRAQPSSQSSHVYYILRGEEGYSFTVRDSGIVERVWQGDATVSQHGIDALRMILTTFTFK